MKKINLPVLVIICIISLFASCAKEGPKGPTGPAGPSYTGAVSGHVTLYDQYGNKVLHGYDSVRILLIPITTIIPGDTTIIPDNSGYYIYNNVITGSYYMTANYTDTAYAATVINNFQYQSGTLNKDIKLSAVPTFSVSITGASKTASGDSLVISCTADLQARSIVVFVNNVLPVDNTPNDYLMSNVVSIPANATRVTVQIPAQALYDLNFTSTNMAYYAVYSGSVSDHSAYEDLTSGKIFYAAVSNPVIDSAQVP